MSKYFKILAFTLVALSAIAFKVPQTSAPAFEGVITYTLTAEGSPEGTKMMNDSSSMQLFIKGDRSEFVVITHMLIDTTKSFIFTLGKDSLPVVLSQTMGKKYRVRVDKEPVCDIQNSDETKEIAGYTCHKANITVKGDKYSSYKGTIYYTEDIPSSYAGEYSQYKSLKGIPLQFTMIRKMMGVTMAMTYTAVSIKKQPVSDDHFIIPGGYKLVTTDEMVKEMKNSMMGGDH